MELLEDRCVPALVAAFGFEETSGTTATDSSGQNNVGTLSGPSRVAGRFGQGLSFNGVNNWVTVAGATSLNLTTGMTLEAWVQPTASNGWESVILKERGTTGLAYGLYGSDGAGKPPAGYINRGSDRSVVGPSTLPLNVWSHLAVTYNASTLQLYVNGILVSNVNQTGATSTSANPLRIGGNSVWGEYFNGLIDEVRIYNTALTQAQIQTDMNTPVVPLTPDTTPPTVSLTAPADGSTVTGSTTISASATDDRSVAGVQFYLDGSTLGAEDTTAPYSMTWNTSIVSAGGHTLTAIARDAAGNTATAISRTVTVVPQLTITAPVNNATITSTTINVTYSTTGDLAGAGVDHVHFVLDGGSEVMDTTFDGVYQFTNVSSGTHTLTGFLVRADDSAIVGTNATTVSFTVQFQDTTPPTVSLTAPANNATVAGSVAISATASDDVAVAGVQFYLDGTPLGAEDTIAPYSVSWNTTTAANGSHTLTARARDTSGNLTTSTARTVSVNNIGTDPSQVGQWSSVMSWPLVAMNAVFLKNGRVLVWDGGPDCIGSTSPRIWDPATGTFTPVPLPYYVVNGDDDLFCSGMAEMADGRILVVGGHDCNGPQLGIAMTNIFDPATMTWTRGPDMHYRRWYPTATTLSDGRVLVTAGSVNNTLDYVPYPEVYDPVANTWTVLTSANQTVPNYPYMFQLPDGRVLAAGSDEAKTPSWVLNVATQTWSVVDPTVLDAGSAVMYLPGKILKAGSSYLSAPTDNGGNVPSTATTYVIDMSQASPTWRQTASMASPRTHLNMTILPDGTVLTTGGSRVIGGVDPSTGVFPAELWSPSTESWTTMASMQRARMYHSTALLLPDGRVLVAGSGHNYANTYAELSAEIYSPPYLFRGARPTVTSAPSLLAYGSSFFVATPDAESIQSVALIRDGSVTHSFNMDQRFIPLTFQVVPGGLMITAPADSKLAPPGHYMLFLVNANGVPSVAPIVRLPAGYEDTQPPTAPNGLTASPLGTSSVTLNWAASTDNIGVTRYSVYRSTTTGFTPSAANRIGQTSGTTYTDAGLPPGTFYYKVMAEDAAGNTSPPSGEASITVTGDITAPTVSLTAPANNATVSGSVTVSANASDNVAVVGVQYYLDGAPLGAEDTTAPYSVAWSTATATNGTHTLTARARDAAGNATTSAAVTVTVSNTAPTGLIAAWGFEDGTGPSAQDVSGNGHTGTLSGATWTTAGRFGNALSFNGIDNLVTVADATQLELTTGMTLEAWVRPNASNGWDTVVLKERGTSGLAYSLYAYDDAGRPPAGYVNRSGTDYEAAGSSALPFGTWTHLATTYDGTNIRLYVNGTLVSTKAISGTITTSTNALRIGGNTIWGEYFDGLIDEVRIYNRALSQTEIQTDMNTPVGGGTGGLAAAIPITSGDASHGSAIHTVPRTIIEEAVTRWREMGATPAQVRSLMTATIRAADLAGNQLGFATGTTIWIDRDAAGHGWFVDPTPRDDSEFAPGLTPPAGMDLLTVMVHEMGHLLGLHHVAEGVMAESLAPGVREVSHSDGVYWDLPQSHQQTPAPVTEDARPITTTTSAEPSPQDQTMLAIPASDQAIPAFREEPVSVYWGIELDESVLQASGGL